jgi:argininosuccinate lyase
LREAAQDPGLVATELADYLVGRGVPFREAHEVVGRVLRAAEQDGKSIRELPIARLKEFSSAFGEDLGNALTVESALARKAAPGGTSPTAVAAALADFKKRIASNATTSQPVER